MGYLGSRQARGAAGDVTNPFGPTRWTVAFTPAVLSIPDDFLVYHIALSGPAPSQVQVFIGTVFYSYAARGDVNDWDPSQLMYVRKGETIFFYWNSGTAPVPVVTLFPHTVV